MLGVHKQYFAHNIHETDFTMMNEGNDLRVICFAFFIRDKILLNCKIVDEYGLVKNLVERTKKSIAFMPTTVRLQNGMYL